MKGFGSIGNNQALLLAVYNRVGNRASPKGAADQQAFQNQQNDAVVKAVGSQDAANRLYDEYGQRNATKLKFAPYDDATVMKTVNKYPEPGGVAKYLKPGEVADFDTWQELLTTIGRAHLVTQIKP